MADWSVLESLILVQAVHIEGGQHAVSWPAVSKLLRQHPLLARPPEFFAPKSCSTKFTELIRTIDLSTTNTRNLDDTPIARLAQRLHEQRVQELENALKQYETQFRQLMQEIDDIRTGKKDHELEMEIRQAVEPEDSAEIKEGEIEPIDGAPSNVQQSIAGKEVVEHEIEGENVVETADVMEVEEFVTPAQDMDVDEPVTPAGPEVPFDIPADQTSRLPSEEQMTARPADEPAGSVSVEPEMPREITDAIALKQEAVDDLVAPSVPLGVGSPQEYSPSPPPMTLLGKEAAERRKSKKRTREDFEDGENDDTSGTETVPSSKKLDEKRKNWKKTSMMIWNKIADHRYGNVFKQAVKEEVNPQYYKVVKKPMTLKTIKNRIRDGEIKTTAEFHRDLLIMVTNTTMYNSEHSDVYNMGLEIKDFIDAEMRNLIFFDVPTRRASVTPDVDASSNQDMPFSEATDIPSSPAASSSTGVPGRASTPSGSAGGSARGRPVGRPRGRGRPRKYE
ncbi:hypothetical protein BJ742DRAFT_818650 [Cladochytrium replicatum]|nr:hypothetical protein BJ742DRAFT_818650 [Cladochytrium replicatum]